jgi:hypothetical protein
MGVSALVIVGCDRDPSYPVQWPRPCKALDEAVTVMYTVEGVSDTDTRLTKPIT